MKRHFFLIILCSVPLFLPAKRIVPTRGIGVYPGRVCEDFSPRFEKNTTRRNLALRRQAFQSSCYDYNLTSQLLTDGIIDDREPCRLDAFNGGTLLPRREREWAIDGGEYTRNVVSGSPARLTYRFYGYAIQVDSVEVVGTAACHEGMNGGGFSIACLARRSGAWQTLGRLSGEGLPGEASRWRLPLDPNKQTQRDMLPARNLSFAFPLKVTGPLSSLRLELSCPSAAYWTIYELRLFYKGKPVPRVLPSHHFRSVWMSAGGEREWVRVDLGAVCAVDEVRLHWIHKAFGGEVQLSRDGSKWQKFAPLSTCPEKRETLSGKARGRYVRVLMERPDDSGRFALSEVEVMGRGGETPVPPVAPQVRGTKMSLCGGDWRLEREMQGMKGEDISLPGYNAARWAVATVPATVLGCYRNIGALPDPGVGDNLFQISESFFNAAFWYRRSFIVPPSMRGKDVFLNLDGINWKARLWLNGHFLHSIEGAFLRGRVRLNPYLREGENVLAVRIEPVAHPGAVKEKNTLNTDYNGGILGLDNPTFHATVGWDWISTIRGRDMGIWNDVWLSSSGGVSLHDPLVTTTLSLPDTLATLAPSVLLHNDGRNAVRGILHGRVGPIVFEKVVTLKGGERREERFSPADFPQLRNQSLHLWWPNGYGEPYLYASEFVFETGGNTLDSISFRTGVRQVECRNADTRLQLYVNGRRIVPLGGNWGFSESDLRYRAREYAAAVAYHRDMHFTMIRNWVGQTGDEEFYDACDSSGIMVWQDFWLANPSDGPDPGDEKMFLENARDYVLRIRRHPSIGLYCGRNEGYPPPSIDGKLREYVAEFHPGIGYISSSADEGVSGHGPYCALEPTEYFARQTGKLHTERGMPCVPPRESLKRMLPATSLWPQDSLWGQHDFVLEGAQRGALFNSMVQRRFGKSDDVAAFSSRAQWVNYDGYRAMFEADSRYRQGLLLWMSHSCWPSMTWQTYDYYMEPTAAYFACKKACEPVHIQFNPRSHGVEVVTRSVETGKSLEACAEVRNLHGDVEWKGCCKVSVVSDSTLSLPLTLPEADDSTARYLCLSLMDGERTLSMNRYVLATADGSLRSLEQLPRVTLKPEMTVERRGEIWRARVLVSAPKDCLAIMVRLILKDKDGEEILPAIYEDNYFHLMPGERREISISWRGEDMRSFRPCVVAHCYNEQMGKHPDHKGKDKIK